VSLKAHSLNLAIHAFCSIFPLSAGKYEVMENLRWSTSGNDGSADWKETVEKWKSEEERFQHGESVIGDSEVAQW